MIIFYYLCSRFAGRSAVGSAPGLGPGGRVFESRRPDATSKRMCLNGRILLLVYVYLCSSWKMQKNPNYLVESRVCKRIMTNFVRKKKY